MSDYTKGKWAVEPKANNDGRSYIGSRSTCHTVAIIPIGMEADARRIVAAVNHFEDIDTENIEALPNAKEMAGVAALAIEAFAAIRHVDESLEGWISTCEKEIILNAALSDKSSAGNEVGRSMKAECSAVIAETKTNLSAYENLRTHTQAVLKNEGEVKDD